MLNIFGQLECEILRIIWQKKRATVREVLETVNNRKKLAYTTVMTIMNRLVKKSILGRRLDNGAYIYFPKQSQNEFLSFSSKKIIDSLIQNFGETAVANFINTFERISPAKLKKLKNKLRQ